MSLGANALKKRIRLRGWAYLRFPVEGSGVEPPPYFPIPAGMVRFYYDYKSFHTPDYNPTTGEGAKIWFRVNSLSSAAILLPEMHLRKIRGNGRIEVLWGFSLSGGANASANLSAEYNALFSRYHDWYRKWVRPLKGPQEYAPSWYAQLWHQSAGVRFLLDQEGPYMYLMMRKERDDAWDYGGLARAFRLAEREGVDLRLLKGPPPCLWGRFCN